MPSLDQNHTLRIQFQSDTTGCDLSRSELKEIEEVFLPLRDLVGDLPSSDLHVAVCHRVTPDDYRVRTSLMVPGRMLFTGDHDTTILSACRRCARKLTRKVTAYKKGSAAESKRAQDYREASEVTIPPAVQPDADALQQLVGSGDYVAFRQATLVHEPRVRERVGRWIERYPQFEAQLDDSFTRSDVVEDVFLDAFERFGERPDTLRLGQWIESLVDPCVKTLLEDPDAAQPLGGRGKTGNEEATLFS